MAVAGMVVLGPFASSSARAGDADFRLNARIPGDSTGAGWLFDCLGVTPEGCTSYAPRNRRFRELAGQLGMVLAPRMATPAATLGHAGFQFAALWSGSFVASDQPYWQVTERAERTGEASPLLQTLQLDLRKGLPLSLEVGAHLQWLVDSGIFAPGLELRWALEEGYDDWPDLAVRAAVSHMVGQRDMNLTTLALQGVVSKDWGLFGTVNVAPYAGWTVIMTTARSRIIDPTPTALSEDVPFRPDVENDFVFDNVDLGDLINHRLTLGFRLLAYVFNVSVQGEFQLLGDTEPVYGITSKVGLDF